MRIWGAVALVLIASAGGQADTADQQGKFEKKLAQIRKRADRGRWSGVRSQIDKLLADHQGKGYVRAHRPLIESLVTRAAYAKAHKPASAKDLVSGKVLSWNDRKRHMKVAYQGKFGDDWEQSEGYLYYRGKLSGALEIDASYERRPIPVFSVHVGIDNDVDIWAALDRRSDHYLRLVLSRGESVLGENDDKIKQEDFGTAFRLRIDRGKATVKTKKGARALLTVPARKDSRYSLTVKKTSGLRIVVSGNFDPEWAQSVASREDARRFARFLKTYKVRDDLPLWLYEKVKPKHTADLREWPCRLGRSEKDLTSMFESLATVGMHELALERAREAKGVDPRLHSYVMAQLLRECGEVTEALEHAQRVVEAEPSFAHGRVLLARLLFANRKRDEGAEAIRTLAAEHPDDPRILSHLLLILMHAGQLRDAKALRTQILGRGLSSKTLDQTIGFLAKADRGPAWTRRYSARSRNYEVASDMGKEVCVQTMRLLEQAHAVFSARLEHGGATKERFRVFVFSSREGYMAYCQSIIGIRPEQSAGVYIPLLKQLAVWNVASRLLLLQVARHEGFHQYLDRVVPNASIWFNEGLAEYYENARVVNGKWVDGNIHKRHVERLHKKLVPLAKFLKMRQPEFLKDAGQSYAQAWAFIHFLRHSKYGRKTRLFDRLWEAFKTYPSYPRAMKHALGETAIGEIETEFKAYVRGLG